MNNTRRSTSQLQQWMQAVITHHGGVQAGVDSDGAQSILQVDSQEIESVILPSRQMSSIERLEVYGNAYYARLIHCLQELFPALRYAVGDEGFDQFALGYLQQFPSTSYTLGKLADSFVSFLDETRRQHFASSTDASPSEGNDDRETTPAWTRFIVELARLEFTIDEVFDGPGIEKQPPELSESLSLVPATAWESLRLTPVVCFRLLAFEFPVNDYFTAFRQHKSPRLPEAQPSYLAITRRDYVVRRYPLNATQYALLSAIDSGATLGEAVVKAADSTPETDPLSQSLSDWFSMWARAPFFAGFEFPDA